MKRIDSIVALIDAAIDRRNEILTNTFVLVKRMDCVLEMIEVVMNMGIAV